MKWTKQEENKIVELLKLGHTNKEIASIIGNRSHQAVKTKLKYLGYSYSMFGGKPEILPEGYKRCPKCDTLKPIAGFNKNSGKKDGLQTYCCLCSREKHNKYYHNPTNKDYKTKVLENKRARTISNRKRVFTYLSENPCVDCGEDDPVVLDFDHKDGSLKTNHVSAMVNYGWKTIKKEMDKCDVRCSNCHRRRTAVQFGWYGFLEK